MRWRFTLTKIEFVAGIPIPTALQVSEPIGWAEISLKLQRHKEWHGVFYEYSLPLKFYNDPHDSTRDAYTFLRDFYELYGVNGSVTMLVELACDDTDDYTDQGFWKLDFAKYKETRGTSCLVELSMEPESRLMTFVNRYDQKVDLQSLESFGGVDLDPYTELPHLLTLPPKAVPVTSDLEQGGTAEDINYTETDTLVAGAGTSVLDALIYTQVGFDIINLDEIANRVDIDTQAYNNILAIQPNWIIVIPGNYTLTLTSFLFTVNLAVNTDGQDNTACSVPNKYDSLDAELWVDIDGTATLIDSDSLSGCLDASDTITLDGTGFSIGPVPLTSGAEIKIYIRVFGQGEFDRALLSEHDITWTFNYNQAARNVKLTALEYADPTTADVFLINEVGSRILEAITDDGFRMLSDYYGRTDSEPYPAPSGVDGCGSLRCLTTGLHIRSYTPGARLRMSFKEYFENNNAQDNIGIGLEDDATRANYQVVRVEPAEFFYESDVVLQLDKIPLVVIEVIHEEHISIFKGGYSKWEAEEYTGLDEFNTGREYRTHVNSVHNTLEQVCDFIASGYAIEITRRIKRYDPFTQQDWRFDNDTFVICIKRGSAPYEVEQGNIVDDANLIDPGTVYNFRISPARNAMRWLRTVLNSYRDPQDGNSQLIFTDGDGNILCEGLLTGDCIMEAAAIAENQNLTVFHEADPFDAHPVYVPETWSFDYPLSFSQYQTLKVGPTKTIQARFGQDANYIDFYLRSVDYKPNEGMASWQLLPKRLYPIDPCLIYIVQTRGTGSNTFGSGLLQNAELVNLFVFVDGHLMKFIDTNPANNEITGWDSTTGFGTLDAVIPVGKQVTIIHIPPMGQDCEDCIHRFDGNGSGNKVPVLTGFGSVSISSMFVFYNGELMKYNDALAANNELTSYVGGTEVLTFKVNTNVNRELRVLGFANCECIKIFTGRGDGTFDPPVTGLDVGTLANILVFYNGNLLIYNDADPANNEILSYDDATDQIFLNTDNPATNASRELRALKLVNC